MTYHRWKWRAFFGLFVSGGLVAMFYGRVQSDLVVLRITPGFDPAFRKSVSVETHEAYERRYAEKRQNCRNRFWLTVHSIFSFSIIIHWPAFFFCSRSEEHTSE